MAMETYGLLDEKGRCLQQLFFSIELRIALLSAKKVILQKTAMRK
jgi:hypothetical protein